MKKFNTKIKSKSKNLFKKLVCGIVVFALTAGATFTSAAFGAAENLSFAQISDVHFLENGTNTLFKMIGESPKLLEDAIEQVNKQPDLDFVMFTGDLIDKSYESELKALMPYLEKINYPWYFTFGNHDRMVGGYLTTSVYLDIVKKSNPKFKFNNAYYAFTPKKGYRIIVLDDIIQDEITSQGYISEGQLKWLKKELDKSKNENVFIFMHIPVIEPFISLNHRLRNSSALLSLIESYKNPIGVFQGHYHAARIVQHENVLYVNSPALVSYPNAFRVVNVIDYQDKLVIDFKWIETGEKTIQKLAKLLVLVSQIYSGEEKDQAATYEIKKLADNKKEVDNE